MRPETIYVFDNGAHNVYPDLSEYHYLFGFQRAATSQDDYQTSLRCKSYPEKRHIYFLPFFKKYGQHDKHGKADDLYALGVTLLEIGLWQSFLKRQDGTYVVDEEIFSAEYRADPDNMHIKFLELAEKKLPCTVGFEYSKIVVDYLRYESSTASSKFEEGAVNRLRTLAERDPRVRRN